MRGKILPPLLALLIAPTVGFAKGSALGNSIRGQSSPRNVVGGVESLLSEALSSVRAEPSDLNVRPSRWETRMKIPAVERLMENPLQIPSTTEKWSGRLERAQTPSDMIRLWADIREIPQIDAAGREIPVVSIQGLPHDAALAINRILSAIEQARKSLETAVSSLTPRERAEALETVRASIFSDPGKSLDSGAFDAISRFDDANMLRAAFLVTQSIDEALPILMKNAATLKGFARTRLHLPFGDVLISGTGDDVYTAKDLDGVALLVDFGGNNRYEAPVATAGENQIRVAIDLGADVTVDASSSPAAGSGVFGIGLMYLPNPKGKKTLSAGDVSLGAGLFGAGGLIARGESIRLDGGRFTQGAGALGIGFIDSKSETASLSARQAGQGFGFTRGLGILRHQGGGSQVIGGLYYPDGHEPSAALSLCQGVGYGPRAFAAGGVGLAMIRGDKNILESSYNSQGSGYWHGFGGLFILGDGNWLTGRRYDQGAGIHTAVGVLKIRGDRNETINWGVGPAFGWDNGIGLLLVDGDANSLGAQWASGKGDVNGHGLAVIRGNNNKLSLADLGTGIFKRSGASYGVTVVEGNGNRFRASALPQEVRGALLWQTTPWGVLSAKQEVILDPFLKPPSHDWPKVDRTQALREERSALSERFQKAEALPPPRRIAELVAIASGGGLDGQTPFQALERLFALTPKDLPDLLRLIDADHFDALIWLRPLIASFGARAQQFLFRELPGSREIRKTLLLGLLRYEPIADAAPQALAALSDSDWRVRGEAAGILGYLLDHEQGEETGRMQLISEMLDAAQLGKLPPKDSPLEKQMLNRIGIKALTDLFGLLALDPDFGFSKKWDVFQTDPNPADSVSGAAIREAAGIIIKKRDQYIPLLRWESNDAGQWEPRVRTALLGTLNDPEPKVRQIGMLALGQIGNPADAAVIARRLEADTAGLREAAATALAKMGPAVKEALSLAISSGTESIRTMAAVSIARTWDPGVLILLRQGMRDSEENVRLSAVAAFSQVQNALQDERKKFAEDLTHLAAEDASPSVRAAAAAALASIPK